MLIGVICNASRFFSEGCPSAKSESLCSWGSPSVIEPIESNEISGRIFDFN